MSIPTETLVGLARDLVERNNSGRDNSEQAMADRMFGKTTRSPEPTPNDTPTPQLDRGSKALQVEDDDDNELDPEVELADRMYILT